MTPRCQPAAAAANAPKRLGQDVPRGVQLSRNIRRTCEKRDKNELRRKTGRGKSASVAHFIFLNACPLSEYMMHWWFIQEALTDCLDSSRPPLPISGLPGEVISLFCSQLAPREVPGETCRGVRGTADLDHDLHSSESWAKAIIGNMCPSHLTPVFSHLRSNTVYGTRRVDQPADHTICLPHFPSISNTRTRFQNAYKAAWGETCRGN